MTAPVTHPSWCDQKHPTDWSVQVHDAQVGAALELSAELAYSIRIQLAEDAPAEVLLVRHDREATTLTRLTPLEAGILRDLLGEGLGLLAREFGR